LGIERYGKINASNSGSESCTGIGVVAGFGAVVLIMQWPQMRNGEVNWGDTFLQILQEVRIIYKTRNQLGDIHEHIDTIRSLAQQAGLSETCMDRIEQAERVVPTMQATIAFVSGYVRQQGRQLD